MNEQLKDERRYHLSGGWQAIRRSDGSVLLLDPDGRASVLSTSNEWASLVAAMSAHGETGRSFAFALRFHAGKWTEARATKEGE